ncbi:Ankyrin-repeat protein with F-box domain [Orpheovirus IHUMI-LCC2]|uniref:Ankyrin-repeat protein with F-box domain n=1 Tax=Orpheovirus IHUMI-LCC2 TaxID=2023057 RepID=A0A2I2L4T1_9VIRU|nr:Ankyrin-repeat protein with F-box domain [Orpheovirus IHUMI-LCC2]SNW62552.1 Ankyrin-repeat protein with F-box domain [Orpheovirus IHUMI-LCC2]
MEEYNFSNIPNELLFNILDDLDVGSITSLCRSNKDNNIVCSEEYDDYWKGRFEKIFDDYKLIGLDGNVLKRNNKYRIPYNNYTSVDEYNEWNKTEFESWYQIVDDIYTELQYANEVLKINNDYNHRMKRNKMKDAKVEMKEIEARKMGYSYEEADNIGNDLKEGIQKNKTTSDVENLYDLIVNQIKISNLEVLNYINSYFRYYARRDDKNRIYILGMINTFLNYTAFYSNKIIYQYLQLIYGRGRNNNKRMRYALRGGNLDMIKYFQGLGVSFKNDNSYIFDVIVSNSDEDTTKEILTLMLNDGVNIDSSAVNFMIKLGKFDILDIIYDNGYKFGVANLNYAIKLNSYNMVLYFIEKGVRPDSSTIAMILILNVRPNRLEGYDDILNLIKQYIN